MQAFITPMPGWAEILVLLGVGVLIFGRRLPEVGRNIGRGIVEFKKGLRGIEDDVDQSSNQTPDPRRIEDGVGPTVQGGESMHVGHDPQRQQTMERMGETEVGPQQSSKSQL